jgi:hypothetical protein
VVFQQPLRAPPLTVRLSASFLGPDAQSVNDTPDTPLLAGRLITTEELSCAKGHVYPLLLVRLALTWVCEAHSSYRGWNRVHAKDYAAFWDCFLVEPC